jgi:hypothetical protein
MVSLTYVETQLSQVISTHPILVQKSNVKILQLLIKIIENIMC